MLIRYLSLLSLMATVAWFFWNPVGWTFQWEPIVVFFASLAFYLGADLRQKNVAEEMPNVNVHPADVRLFEELKDLLPSSGAIKFLKEHDFLGSYKRSVIDPIDTFRWEWDNTEHQFMDQELEALRKELYDRADHFFHTMAVNTSPNDAGFQAVRSDRVHVTDEKPHEYWNKKFREEANQINEAADELVETHQKLFLKARQRLAE